MTPQIEKALNFAREAHNSIGQKRKYSGMPYWVHVEEVTNLTWNFLPGDEIAAMAAAAHDVLEDVAPLKPEYGIEAITRLFGFDVAKIVRMLTDVYTPETHPTLNRAQRKTYERLRYERMTASVKHYQQIAPDDVEWIMQRATQFHTVKCADLVSNTHDIATHDPKFAVTYLAEKKALLEVLEFAVPEARAAAWASYEAAIKVLEYGKA